MRYFDSNGRVIFRKEDEEVSNSSAKSLLAALNASGLVKLSNTKELTLFLNNCPKEKLEKEIMPIVNKFLKS